ncbi:hypothetical protein KO505_14000 [Psychrosphaera sp. F3M07]|uniref:hypothetical protein n=1 Tax=Psychrosphaera sp. F3M07 TaxID=2841560 RepID=UPI001C086882|nr:hypothetical protein [Psychrosphaera sp. F3M07]MBU2919065.1 hypothetical protein [Psychrosphaera sp. F3M07]
MSKHYELTERVQQRIKQQVFRIMKNKLSGKESEQLKTIYRMIKIGEDIYQRFRTFPMKWQLKHLSWWVDEVGFWYTSEWREYRYHLAIRKFCICRHKEHWRPSLFSNN